ncbi:hypothetical protein [Paludisphaera rhizosphaerae]|uniref:hypothetical protein n=1 Tax=Paludisphaera rhizosphaerae TaxID=2711216 RepID=UPI001F101032|nr:hypothetical protein [Paludisphaera rhizosphaerae]
MARIRTLAGGFAAWVALGGYAGAAPLSWFDSQASLTAWYANQLNNAGNIYAPTTSSNSITNINSSWYGVPTPTTVSVPVAKSATPAAVSVAPTVQAATTSATYATQVTPTTTASNKVDAFINMGSGPYAEASDLASGNPQPWFKSPAASAVFGGTPTAAEQSQFTSDVLAKVEKTFSQSGLNDFTFTTDPNVPATHMMSVVSGASYSGNANAIGITDVGNNGFSFIDKLNYASNEDQLSWAVAHNVSHELMHAFGIGQHPDQTGDYIDAGTANWSLLTNSNATFSPSAVSLLQNVDASSVSVGLLGAEELHLDGDQILAAPVPEPATVAVWMIAGLGGVLTLRRRTGRQTA